MIKTSRNMELALNIRHEQSVNSLIQLLAEECSELSQACLKYLRARGVGTYTPKSAVQTFDDVVQETADVLTVIDVLIGDAKALEKSIEHMKEHKLERWNARNEEKKVQKIYDTYVGGGEEDDE